MTKMSDKQSAVWYAVHTKPHQEQSVAEGLKSRKIETFLPIMETETVLFGKRMRKLQALFPSYIFAKFVYLNNWQDVRWQPGVRDVVNSNHVPLIVNDDVIRFIKRQRTRQGVIRISRSFKSGQSIRVKCGPFKDLEGIFIQHLEGNDRVRIFLRAIQYCSKLEMHASLLEAV